MARFNIITQRTPGKVHEYTFEGKSILYNRPIEYTLEAIAAGIEGNSQRITQMLKSGDTHLIEEYILTEFFGVDVSKYDSAEEEYAEDSSTAVLDYCTKTVSMARRFTHFAEVENEVVYIDITAAIDSKRPCDVAIGSVGI